MHIYKGQSKTQAISMLITFSYINSLTLIYKDLQNCTLKILNTWKYTTSIYFC